MKKIFVLALLSILTFAYNRALSQTAAGSFVQSKKMLLVK
jgi:hypothetical protein